MKIETWHADSLAGPMGEIKKAFEAKNTGLTVNLTSAAADVENALACEADGLVDPVQAQRVDIV